MCILEPVCIYLTLCGLEKIHNSFKPPSCAPSSCVFKIIKDVYCTIIPPWKKSSKNSLKAGNYHDSYPMMSIFNILTTLTLRLNCVGVHALCQDGIESKLHGTNWTPMQL